MGYMSRLSEFQAWGAKKPATATAREIVQHSYPMDFNTTEIDGKMYRRDEKLPPDTVEAVMERKYKRAKDIGIAEDIRKRGIVHPIRMTSGLNEDLPHFIAPRNMYEEHVQKTGDADASSSIPMVYNGQHRVAVMYHEQPDTPINLEWDNPKGKWDKPTVNQRYNKTIPPVKKIQ